MGTFRKNTVWQLLRRNISPGQLIGYSIASLTGLAIVTCAIQFYNDISSLWNDEDSFLTRDYTVISHKVNGLGSFVSSGSSNGFTQEEITDISSQPWVRRIAPFTPATFNVAATVDMGNTAFSSALFFESIPDDFFDVLPEGWGFDKENPEIPIIISKDYLSLYNFGFASSRGLPQLSEAMIGMVPLKVSISGNGHQQWLPARIAGFSSRLNTIAVPDEFIKWANENFGEISDPVPSRLIIEIKRPGDPAIKEYLAAHDYEQSGDKADNGKASYFLSIVTATVISIGAVISLLSFFILILSVYLLLQKNRRMLCDLMLLGYSPDAVAKHYYVMIALINAIVLVFAIAILIAGQHAWIKPLENIGIESASPYIAILSATAIMTATTIINIIAIRRTMLRYFMS